MSTLRKTLVKFQSANLPRHVADDKPMDREGALDNQTTTPVGADHDTTEEWTYRWANHCTTR